MATVTFAALVCAACAVVVALSPAPGVSRVGRILGDHASARRDARRGREVAREPHHDAMGELLRSSRGRMASSLLAGLASMTVVGGVSGAVLGAGLGAGAWFGLGRLEPRSRARDRERVVAMVPLAADLVSAALTAGCPPVVAVQTVGAAIGGPLGRALLDVSSASNVGADPTRAWAGLAAEPAVRPLARALVAAMSRGTSPAPVLHRVAADTRDAARWAGEARARSLGARAAAPLGLCFLPAFVLVGVVPIVATTSGFVS